MVPPSSALVAAVSSASGCEAGGAWQRHALFARRLGIHLADGVRTQPGGGLDRIGAVVQANRALEHGPGLHEGDAALRLTRHASGPRQRSVTVHLAGDELRPDRGVGEQLEQ